MGSFIVGAVVLAMITAAVFAVVRDRKNGGCAGGCGSCNGCPSRCDGRDRSE